MAPNRAPTVKNAPIVTRNLVCHEIVPAKHSGDVLSRLKFWDIADQ